MWGVAVDNKAKKAFKLPRHLLAIIANDNPQAIKALENLEIQTMQTLPEQVEILQKAVDDLDQNLQNAVMVAYQALAVAHNAQKQNNGYLGAVGVSEQAPFFLKPIGVMQ